MRSAEEKTVLLCALDDDLEGLKRLLESKSATDTHLPENILLERDEVGRNALCAACTLGLSGIVRELVQNGADVNEFTAREAKQRLRALIQEVRDIIADQEKVQGKLSKEDKNMCINICSAKSDWIHNSKNATIQDFIEQEKLLKDTLAPILLKLNTQPEATTKTRKH
ncbi:ankyrin repeat domain-containing protein 45 isoform X2 [Pseudorasbora parva]|uniref:ankyrin repeat domain-containing protein 45 isoform X2 n=1 Tax=Pseudorasbora parva TaxID=51549 RepID=UPI00351F218F